ncbi:MAG: glucosamine-6-phosphate deaminase [Candidatus Marinimicrobia bacterium]|nr:glucosamine-6-phosphate deaminase [Candidatus Neomarinimicrobiota bacterium]
MEVIIKADYEQMSAEAAAKIADLVYHQPNAVLGLATGSTPLGLYRELIRLHREDGLDFSKVITFNLDEYVGLPASHEQSYNYFMRDKLFNHINVNPSNLHIPNGMASDIDAYCLWYEEEIKAYGGIDIQILGIGSNGHIAFNEPASSLGSRTRLKTLTKQTIDGNARFFDDLTEVPRYAITMGVGTIMEAKTCILLASGKGKADTVAKAIEGPVTSLITASALQLHPDAIFILDEEAASSLQLYDYYHWIYDNKPD